MSAPPPPSPLLYSCGNRNTVECKVHLFNDIKSSVWKSPSARIPSSPDESSDFGNKFVCLKVLKVLYCTFAKPPVRHCLMKGKFGGKQPTCVLFCNLFWCPRELHTKIIKDDCKRPVERWRYAFGEQFWPFRILLEPQCTGSIRSSQHPMCLETNFSAGSY